MSKVTSGGEYSILGQKKKFRLKKPDYSGGEKAVFVQNGLAYCIFHDPSKMIPDGKFTALNALDHPNIMRPLDIVIEAKKGTKVGFTTDFIKDAYTLAETFPKAFKVRHGYEQDDVLANIRQLFGMAEFVHSKNCLIVDFNELNVLVSPDVTQLYLIDVNSYQAPGYHATAIMESIRDRHCLDPDGRPKWSENTDWYSAGILSFQMFHGIHPFRGNHDNYASVEKDKRMFARMDDHCSLYDPDARYPAVVYPLDSAPSGLRDWWKAMFQDGKRMPPPSDFSGAVIVVATVTKMQGSNLFDIPSSPLFTTDGEIYEVATSGGKQVIVTNRNVYCNKRRVDLPGTNIKVGFSPKMNRPVAAWTDNGQLRLSDLDNDKPLDIKAASSGVFVTEDNRIIYKSGGSMMEVVFNEHNQHLMAAGKQVGKVSAHAAQVFDGVVIQNLLGQHFASFFPAPGVCKQIALSELSDYRKIVDARCSGKLLVVNAVDKDGKYDRLVFIMSSKYDEYVVRKKEDITPVGINFTVNDGQPPVCVMMNEDGCVEAFQVARAGSDIKEFPADPDVTSDVKLFSSGSQILFSKGNELYSMAMKRKK